LCHINLPTEDLQRLLKKARFVKLKVFTVHAFTCFYGSCSYLFSSVSPKSSIHPCPPWLSALVSLLPGPHMILMPSCACLFSILHMCSCSLHIFSATNASVKSYQLVKVVSGGRAPGKSSSLASPQLLVIEQFHCFGAVRLEKVQFFLMR
jgi:hypothetical protein